jgi:hypothetical protein
MKIQLQVFRIIFKLKPQKWWFSDVLSEKIKTLEEFPDVIACICSCSNKVWFEKGICVIQENPSHNFTLHNLTVLW